MTSSRKTTGLMLEVHYYANKIPSFKHPQDCKQATCLTKRLHLTRLKKEKE